MAKMLEVMSKIYAVPSWMPDNGAKFDTLDEAARSFLNLFSAVAALVAVAVLIYGGISYMLSSGDSAKTEKAQNTIIYALVGLVIVGLAYLVIGFILNFMGVDPQDIDQR